MNTDNSSFDRSEDKSYATYDSGDNISDDSQTDKKYSSIQRLTQEAELESEKKK